MLTFVLGGARSGKSDLAVKLANGSGRSVLFLATMEPGDEETRARISTHQSSRPENWRTIEEPRQVVRVLRDYARSGEFVLLDCMTLWVTNLLAAHIPDENNIPVDVATRAVEEMTRHAYDLVSWAKSFDGDVTVVSNEAGQGVIPAYPLGRVFRDSLGVANRIVARDADRVYYLVAGLALDLKEIGALSIEDLAGEASP